MSLHSLLEKEIHWSARNALVLVFLLLLLPAFFAGTSLLFQDVIPRDVPVAVTPADDSVNETEMEIVEGGIASFSDPVRAESLEVGREMLERESVYAVVEVPANVTNPEATVEFHFVVDGAIVPFLSPSEVIGGLLESELDAIFEADVSAEREVVGEEKSLPEYLFPSFLMTLIIFFAFTYVPYNLKNESAVLDRLRVEASLESLVTAKLLFFTTLLVVPIGVFHGAALYYGYAIDTVNPWALGLLVLTFLFLSTVSVTVMVLSRFSGSGQFVNLVLLLGLVGFSGLVFPRGFFSPLRTTIIELLPTHYAMVAIRSLMLKGSEIALFSEWVLGLVGLQLLAIGALKGAIIYYRRSS